MNIFDRTMNVLEVSLDLRTINQNVISSNITNADTPNYKGKVMEFEEEFQNYVKNLREGSHASLDPKYGEDPLALANNDGNSVKLDREMSRLAKNSIMYNASA